MTPAEHREAAAQHALAHGADLLRDALAAPVTDRRENLDALEVGVREPPRRLRRNALPRRARPDPVAEVRDAGCLVHMTQAARAEETAAVEDPELEARAFLTAAQRGPNPLLRVLQRVRRPAPVHPAADLDARFVHGAKYRERIPHLQGPDVDPRSQFREHAENQAEPPLRLLADSSRQTARRNFERGEGAAGAKASLL